MTVLIIGGSGFLGMELVRRATSADAEAAATFATSRPGTVPGVIWRALDVRDPAQVAGVISEVSASVVINASSGGADWEITAEGLIDIAMAAARLGVRLVHVSSDAVFSGAGVHYAESCLPDPLTPCGAAKAAAETAVRLLVPSAVIARTSLIIGYGRSVHERTVHALVAGTREGVLFTDDVRCPVHAEDLAAALLEVALSDAAGVLHLAGPDALSRHDLGRLIAQRDGLDATRLPAGRRVDAPLPGALDVRLDGRATQERLGTRIRGACEFLRGNGRVIADSRTLPRPL
ncbi:sugar nucleotide-binding protein [Streptomyces sp. NPDC091383]|uniref:sugar nucleotide-binding protein n=1 Tax=Streptomyces sp. NPDC091383 TaxID=3365996 RepID=UPI0037F7F446